jgi:hypothetical protein
MFFIYIPNITSNSGEAKSFIDLFYNFLQLVCKHPCATHTHRYPYQQSYYDNEMKYVLEYKNADAEHNMN